MPSVSCCALLFGTCSSERVKIVGEKCLDHLCVVMCVCSDGFWGVGIFLGQLLIVPVLPVSYLAAV